MNSASEEECTAEAVALLRNVVTIFTDRIGRPPAIGEFLEILGWSVPSGADYIDSPVRPVLFKAKVRGTKRSDPVPSSIPELDDHPFVEASDFIASVQTALSATGEELSSARLATGILRVVHASNVEFLDARAADLQELAIRLEKPRRKVKIGDLLAIPLEPSGFRLAVVVARNRFGTAIGFLGGPRNLPRINVEPPGAAGPIAYTDEQSIANGTWLVVGHDDALLSRFPSEPEIYHSPDLSVPGIDIGEFGAAESPEGNFRKIGPEEAQTVGLLGGGYRQVYVSTHLNQLLNEGLFG